MSYINKSYLIQSFKDFKSVVLDPLFNKKVDKDQGTAAAGKALIIGTDGLVTTGDAGVSVSKATGNTIEEKTDGIYVGAEVWQGTKQEYEDLDKSTLTDGQTVIITDDYQTCAPIVTAWDETPVDTSVPSEKLVKETLDICGQTLAYLDNKLQLLNGTNVLSEVTIEGGESTSSALNITTTTLVGETVTATLDGGEVITGVFDDNGKVTLKLHYIGTYVITCTNTITTKSIEIDTLGAIYSTTLDNTTEITFTIESAKLDTVSVYDTTDASFENPLATYTITDGCTKSGCTLSIPTDGDSYVFKSTIAKDTSDISKYYTKTITLTSSTTTVKVMPDYAMYWYGNTCTALSGGWIGVKYSSGVMPTISYQSDNIYYSVTSSNYMQYLATNNAIDLTGKTRFALSIKTTDNQSVAVSSTNSDAPVDVGAGIGDTGVLSSVTLLSKSFSGKTVAAYPTIRGKTGFNLYALWFE